MINMENRHLKLSLVLTTIAERSATCADVAVVVGRDRVTITQCPPAILTAVMALARRDGPIHEYDVAVGHGGVSVSLR